MRSRALVLGWCPGRAGESLGKCIRVVVVLAAAMTCVGWLSSVAVAAYVCVEGDSYCRDVNVRCTYSGSGENCCAYTCAPDESCTEPDPWPPSECEPPAPQPPPMCVCIVGRRPGCDFTESTYYLYNLSPYWYKVSALTWVDGFGVSQCSGCYTDHLFGNSVVAPNSMVDLSPGLLPNNNPCGDGCYSSCDNTPYGTYCPSHGECGTSSEVYATVGADYIKLVGWSVDGYGYHYWSPSQRPVVQPAACAESVCGQ